MTYQFRIDSAGDLRIARHIITKDDPCDGQNNDKSGCQNKPVWLGLFPQLSLGWDLNKTYSFVDGTADEEGDEDEEQKTGSISIGCLRLCPDCADAVAMTDSEIDLMLIADARKTVVGHKEIIPRGAFSKTRERRDQMVEFVRQNPWVGVAKVADHFKIIQETARKDLYLLRDEGRLLGKLGYYSRLVFAVPEVE